MYCIEIIKRDVQKIKIVVIHRNSDHMSYMFHPLGGSSETICSKENKIQLNITEFLVKKRSKNHELNGKIRVKKCL